MRRGKNACPENVGIYRRNLHGARDITLQIVYFTVKTMLLEVLEISAMLGIVALPLLFPANKKLKKPAIRIPKNYNDTSDAHFAINENGFLEEIRHDKLSSHTH
jgi:hypothetical protein